MVSTMRSYLVNVHTCNLLYNLIILVINGEKATLETPTFAQKRRRTLDMLIRSLYQDLMPDLHKVTLGPWSFPPYGV